MMDGTGIRRDNRRRGDPRDLPDISAITQNTVTAYPYVPSERHSHSPRNHASASVSPLSRPPFGGAPDHNCFVRSPDSVYSDRNVGMDISRFSVGRNTLYDREHLGNRDQADTHYSDGQSHDSVHVAGYHSTRNGSYLGLTPQDIDSGNFYGRSALENSHFNRGLPITGITALPDNHALVHNHLNHYNCHGDEFVKDDLLERKLALISHGSPSPISSTPPYNKIMENYSYRADSTSAAVTNNLEMTALDRTANPISSPLPSYIPFGTGSNYVGYNPALYHFPHFNPSFTPDNYSPYSSSVSHQTNYGQFSAPPPAHTRFHDLVQKPGFGAGEKTQSLELPGKPFDATVPRNPVTSELPWGHASVTTSKRGNDTCTSVPSVDATNAFENQSQAFRREDTHDRLVGNEFLPVGRKEKRRSGQNEPSSEIPNRIPIEGQHPWTGANLMSSDNKSKLTSVSRKCSHRSMSNSRHTVTSAAGDRMTHEPSHQKIFCGESAKHDRNKFHFSSQTDTTTQNNLSLPDARKIQPTLSRNISDTSQYRVTSNLNSDSSDSGEDTEIEEKTAYSSTCNVTRDGATAGQRQSKKQDLVLPHVTDRSVTKPTAKSNKKTQSHAKTTQGQASIKEPIMEQLYDSSTSEYEPPSPYQVPVKEGNQRSKQKMSARKRSTTTCAEKSDDTVVEGTAPRIRLVIKTEKNKEMQTSRKPVIKKSKRTKRRAANRMKVSGKKDNRTCPVCQKIFSRADSLTCHMRVHTGDRPYHCEYCGATYKVSSHLRDHIRSKHSNAKPFECERCGKPFTYSTARRRHEKICGKDLSERVQFQCANCGKGFVTSKGFSKHEMKCGVAQHDGDDTKYKDSSNKCRFCKKNFETFSGLERHQRFVCGKLFQNGRYVCGECGKSFLKRNRYVIHIRQHTGEKPFRCSQCETSFYDKNTLKRHMDRHDGNKNFRCSLCDAAFYSKRCMSLHMMRIHCGIKLYKCKDCGSDFSSGYKLSRHVRRVHRQERRFKCTLCGKSFFDGSTWMKHMCQHAFQSDKSNCGRNVKQHDCKICNLSFSMKELRTHVASKHPGITLSDVIAKQRARCEVCSKDFSCQESLRVHKLRHSGQKPFQCNHCDMAFVLKSALDLHQRKHTDYRPHCCPECGKTFRWRASVSQHILTYHTSKSKNCKDDIKKFTCPECGKKFKRQMCLNVHRKRHCSVMPCICSQCGKGFVDLCRLKIHMSVHDGPKPFMCESCGAGFFYQYLLDDHKKRRHSELPKQEWLCEECGKSLCRKDSLQKHMALHAKYQGGQIPKAGRRKGDGHPSKFSKVLKSDTACAGSVEEGVKEPSLRNTFESQRLQDDLSVSTLQTYSELIEKMNSESAVFETEEANLTLDGSVQSNHCLAQPFQEQPYRYHLDSYTCHSIPCPSTAEH